MTIAASGGGARGNADAPATPPARPSTLVLIAMAAIGPAALNIFIPSMPGLVREFQTDHATVQLTLTLYLLGLAAAQLVYGPVSDRYGRRPVVLVGIALYVAGMLLALAAVSIEMLIAARVLQAVGGCVGLVIGRAIVRDVWPRDQAASVLGLVTAAMAVAPAIAPSLGGALDGWLGWRAGFVLMAIAGAGVWLACLTHLPETAPRQTQAASIRGLARGYATVLRSPVFLGYAGCSAFCASAFFGFLAGAPFVVVEFLGHPPVVYGAAFALISIGYMVGNGMASRLSVRLGAPRMVALGTSSTVLGCALMVALAASGQYGLFYLFVPMMLVAIGNGMLQPNAISAAVGIDPAYAGTAAGAAGCIQMILGGAATQVVGLLHGDGGPLPMVSVMLTGAVIGAAFFWGVAKRADR
ncbi:MAG: Bcr/CflA family efflux MFS transporter [Alphaproteobacteria bacterium]|nr:MAG: Bcr/CflA family efflux MFS transporter [Alphaproteobacteria bacterium]